MNNERQQKKAQFSMQQKKSRAGKIISAVAVIAAIGAVAAFLLWGQGAADSYTRVESVNGEIRLELNSVADGQAHYFKYAGGTGDINFFVVKSVDGVLRAAFDACDVCYREKKGYRQEGITMVCNNCNMKFRTDLVNEVKGGCNPAPLLRRIEANQLVINERDILQGAGYFGG